MAGKGTYSALQALTPIQQDFGDDLRDIQDENARIRQDKAFLNQQQQRRQEKANQFKSEAYKRLATNATGYNGIDEGIADYVYNELSGKLNEQFEILEKDPNNWKARLEIERITRQPEQLAQMSANLRQRNADLMEGIKKGTYNEELNRKQIDAFNSMLKEGRFALNYQNGETKLFIDSDLDDFNDVDQGGWTLASLLSGDSLGPFVENFDIDGFIGQELKMMSTSTETNPVGGFGEQTIVRANPEAVKGLNTRMDRIFGSDLSSMTNAARTSFLQKGLRIPQTDAEFQQFKNELASGIVNSVSPKNETTINESARTSAARENRLNRESKSKTISVGTPVSADEATWKGKAAPGAKSIPISNMTYDSLIDAESGETLSNATVNNVSVDSNGNLIADVSFKSSEGTSQKTITNEELDELKAKAERLTTQFGSNSPEARRANAQVASAKADKTGNVTITEKLPEEFERRVITLTSDAQESIARESGSNVQELIKKAGAGGAARFN